MLVFLLLTVNCYISNFVLIVNFQQAKVCWAHIEKTKKWIQTTSTYANAEVISSVVKLLKNTRIPIFSTKLLSSFILPIEKIRKS